MAISNRLSAQINGLTAAMRNANDGISLVQTAESAMGQITDNLQRMRELAVQSANGTNQASDRTALNTEFLELREEIERLADSTSFNGVNLLNGPAAAINIQVGADNAVTDSTNQVDIGTSALINAQTASLGSGSVAVSGSVSQAITAFSDASAVGDGEIEVNGTNIGAVALGGDTGSYAQNIAFAIMGADSDITATVGASSLDLGQYEQIAFTNDGTYKLEINGIEVIAATGTTGDLSATNFQAALDSKQSELAAIGITYTGSTSGTDAGNDTLVFTKADGGNINFKETLGDASTGVGADNTDATIATGDGFANSDLTLTAPGNATTGGYGSVTLASDFDIVIEAGTALNSAKIGVGAQGAGAAVTTYDTTTTTSTALASVSLTSEANAQTALTSVDTALDTINAARAELGAVFTRLDAVSSNLSSTIENYTAANSRVQDADFAVESANLARTQVLQQAGVSVLAQANALPQQVLALLQ
jgi:flagellin